jgi:hypothetical protein
MVLLSRRWSEVAAIVWPWRLSSVSPSKASVVPSVGYRLRLERDGDHVRLITRGGYNWTDRYPWIVEAAREIRQKRFV